MVIVTFSSGEIILRQYFEMKRSFTFNLCRIIFHLQSKKDVNCSNAPGKSNMFSY